MFEAPADSLKSPTASRKGDTCWKWKCVYLELEMQRPVVHLSIYPLCYPKTAATLFPSHPQLGCDPDFNATLFLAVFPNNLSYRPSKQSTFDSAFLIQPVGPILPIHIISLHHHQHGVVIQQTHPTALSRNSHATRHPNMRLRSRLQRHSHAA